MGTRREELSTADLAGQPPTGAERSDVTEEEADLVPDDRAEAGDRTDDDVARDDLAPDDLAPEEVARDDLAGDPALTEGHSPDMATDVEPSDQPLQHGDRRDEVSATDTDPDLASSTPPAAPTAADTATKAGHLLAADDAEAFRARWTDVQHGFVDAPRRAVEQADRLVAEVMQHLAKTFADERGKLEGQWDQGDEISTEDLRTAFQRYRLFFERLLTT
jgi:hypothetical protein